MFDQAQDDHRDIMVSDLREAAGTGDVHRVQLLLDEGAPIDAVSSMQTFHKPPGCDKCTALERGCAGGHLATVQLLLSRGAAVNLPWHSLHPSALQIASKQGHAAICRLLIAHGANVDVGWAAADLLDCDYSPLEIALFMAAPAPAYEDVACLLLEHGAHELDLWRRRRQRATRDRSLFGREQAVGRHLLLLQAAVENGYERAAMLLVEKGAVPLNVGPDLQAMLVTAAAMGFERVVAALLEWDADVNGLAGRHGQMALHAAAAGGFERVVEVLLGAGADVECREGDYGTPLQAACAGGHEKVVQVLLDRGADVDVRNKYYDTPLEEATYGGHGPVIALLAGRKVGEIPASQTANQIMT